MQGLKAFVAAVVVVLSVLTCLPAATHCDTSYYEKYYAARRFVPLKRNALLPYNFTVTVNSTHTPLADYEQVALVGNLKQLGGWRGDQAILLNRTKVHNVWHAQVQLPQNSSVEYRYFIAAVTRADSQGASGVQVRHWESSLNARAFNTSKSAGNRTDTLGLIDGQVKLTRGWLTSGHIVQFKLFRNPLTIQETGGAAGLRVRLQVVDPVSLLPILPSARANVEYVRMAYADSFLRAQPEYGVPYVQDDIVMFHATVAELANVAFLLKIYATQPDNELARLIGYQHVQATSLLGSEGNISIKLLSPIWLNTVGQLDLQYLVIKPMPNSTFDFRTSFANYWRSDWTALEIGHRGLGKSLTVTSNAAPLIENTVASMKTAGELGADIVEFDVQLTSDLVPIIHHDFVIRVCMDSKTPTTKNDLSEVLIKDVTYEQLKNLKTYQIIGTKIVEYPAHNSVEQVDQRLFPTLEDFFMSINLTIGFDIEIKWPQQRATGEFESEQSIDKNLFVDRILEVVQQAGCGRLNLIKSFDADICTLLRFKQNMYPVLFLTSSKEYVFADPRTDTIVNSINFAQAFDFAGIVPNAVFIKSDPTLIALSKAQLPIVLIWGSDIKDRESIDWFKATGPTGVIYDRMDLWLPANKTNAFDAEPDLPELFQLQCTPTAKKRATNATIESILSNVNLL